MRQQLFKMIDRLFENNNPQGVPDKTVISKIK